MQTSGAAAAAFACRRDVAVLETIYSCGLRISELCGLVAQDIDWNERLVRVRGKGKKERLIPIGEPALEAIRNYWGLLPQTPAGESPVFLAGPKKRAPISPRHLQLRLKKHLALAGLDPHLTPHKLRHSYATHLLDARRGPAQRSGVARPRTPGHDPDLHPPDHGTAQASLRRGASQGLAQRVAPILQRELHPLARQAGSEYRHRHLQSFHSSVTAANRVPILHYCRQPVVHHPLVRAHDAHF